MTVLVRDSSHLMSAACWYDDSISNLLNECEWSDALCIQLRQHRVRQVELLSVDGIECRRGEWLDVAQVDSEGTQVFRQEDVPECTRSINVHSATFVGIRGAPPNVYEYVYGSSDIKMKLCRSETIYIARGNVQLWAYR